MKFSITIPAYKTKYLDKAIQSVLCQTYSDWELIIVDDFSPEDIQAVVKNYLNDKRIRYYRNSRNCGAKNVVENWNICLSYCTGDYVICIGDDDLLKPCCLKEYSELIQKYPNLNVYHAWTEIIDEDGKVFDIQEPRPEWESGLLALYFRWKGRIQFIGDFCYKTEHLRKNGGYFFLPYAWGSDDITAFRAAIDDGVANTSVPCFQYRENRLSISSSSDDEGKMLAVKEQEKWYTKVLTELKQGNPECELTNITLNYLQEYLNTRYEVHVYSDLHKHPSHVFHWLKIRKDYHLSLFYIIKVFLGTLIKRR